MTLLDEIIALETQNKAERASSKLGTKRATERSSVLFTPHRPCIIYLSTLFFNSLSQMSCSTTNLARAKSILPQSDNQNIRQDNNLCLFIIVHFHICYNNQSTQERKPEWTKMTQVRDIHILHWQPQSCTFRDMQTKNSFPYNKEWLLYRGDGNRKEQGLLLQINFHVAVSSRCLPLIHFPPGRHQWQCRKRTQQTNQLWLYFQRTRFNTRNALYHQNMKPDSVHVG